jgi:DNA ligase 1
MDTHADAIDAQPRLKLVPLYPEVIENEDALREVEERYLNEGHEGVMLRRADGPYKFGRSTIKEFILAKLKRFADAEATVIGFEELSRNGNVAEENAFGRTKRGHSKEGLTAAGTLGSLHVRSEDGLQFNIGTGFSSSERDDIWRNREHFLGKTVRYRFFPQGVKTLPRFPSFAGWRED